MLTVFRVGRGPWCPRLSCLGLGLGSFVLGTVLTTGLTDHRTPTLPTVLTSRSLCGMCAPQSVRGIWVLARALSRS